MAFTWEELLEARYQAELEFGVEYAQAQRRYREEKYENLSDDGCRMCGSEHTPGYDIMCMTRDCPLMKDKNTYQGGLENEQTRLHRNINRIGRTRAG